MKRALTAGALAAVCLTVSIAASAPAEQRAASPLPAGMVAFFDGPNCPAGWSDAARAWRGRYLVVAADRAGAMVGTALAPSENRPTGEHTHTGAISFYGGSCPTQPTGNCVRWAEAGAGRGPRPTGGAQPMNDGETIVPGTNAPYVELRACVKR